MEDIGNVRGVLQTTLDSSRGLSPKLAGLIRRFKAVATLLLMKRDSAYSDLDKYTNCLRNWVEEFDKKMRSSIQLAFEEKAAIIKAYREELEEEMSTLGVLLKESEKLLQISTNFDATLNEHGKTLITALKMMKTTSRLETRDVDENLSCLKLSTQFASDKPPELGQLVTSYSSDEMTAQEMNPSQSQSNGSSNSQVSMQSESTQTENEPQTKIQRSNSGQRSKEKRLSNNQRFVLSQLEKGGISKQGPRVTEAQTDRETASLDHGSHRGDKTRKPLIREAIFKPVSPTAKKKVDKKGDRVKDKSDKDLAHTTHSDLRLSRSKLGLTQPSKNLENKNVKDFSWENEVVNVEAKEIKNQPPNPMPVFSISKTSDAFLPKSNLPLSQNSKGCPPIPNNLTPISKSSDNAPHCANTVTIASKTSHDDSPNQPSVNPGCRASEIVTPNSSSGTLASNVSEVGPPNPSSVALVPSTTDCFPKNQSSETSDICVVGKMSEESQMKTSSEKRIDLNANVCAEKQASSLTNQKGDNEVNTVNESDKAVSKAHLSKTFESRQDKNSGDFQSLEENSTSQVAVPKKETSGLEEISRTETANKTQPMDFVVKSEPLSPVVWSIKEEPQTPTDLNNNTSNIFKDQQVDKKVPLSSKETWKSEVEPNNNEKSQIQKSLLRENGSVVISEIKSQHKVSSTETCEGEIETNNNEIPQTQKSLSEENGNVVTLKENGNVVTLKVDSQQKTPVSNELHCSVSDIPLPETPWPGPIAQTLPSKNPKKFVDSVITQHIREESNKGKGKQIPPVPAKLLFKVGKKDQMKFPIGVTTNSAEEILVADTGNHVVQIFNSQGKFLREMGREIPMKRPSAIVVNHKDDVFVKDDIAVYAFSAQGKLMRTIAKGKLGHPFGLALTPDGLLVTVDTTRNNPRVVILSQDGSQMNSFPFAHLLNPRTPTTSKCRFLAVQAERLIVSDLGNSCIYISDNCGEILFEFGEYGTSYGKFKEPSGVTTDQQGHMLIGDSKNDRIQIFKPNGSFLCDIQFDTAIQRPSDIHLTRDGKLYVSNFLQHQVFVYQLGQN